MKKNIGFGRGVGWVGIFRRVFELILVITALLMAFPLLLIVSCAIKLDSPGPIFFRQVRLGLNQKNFLIWKFRSMTYKAEEIFPERSEYALEEWEVGNHKFHSENDPRVTRVGRILRKSSIDELPNLLNVLFGDIALVGPRPEIPAMLKYYGDSAEKVFSVKPGVTSWAKVNGRDMLSFSETLGYELWYVANRSFWLDLKILAKTVWVVLACRNVLT